RRRKRRFGVALIVAGTIAASAAAGGVAGSLASQNSGGASPSAGAPVTSSSVNTPVSAKDQAPASTVGTVAKAVLPSVVQVTVQTYQGTSVGSGVILSADGKILTNNHV